MTPRETTGSDSYDRRDVESALRDILAADQFVSSAQLSSFLKYIVTKKLDGEEEDIKAYSIAVDALGRPEDFDPQENAFVRVAAGRLRQVLALYNAGQSDVSHAVRIELEPGSYVPEFVILGNAESLPMQETANEIILPADEVNASVSADASTDTQPATVTEVESRPAVFSQPPTFASKWWRLVVAGIGLAVLANLAIGLYLLMRPAPIATPRADAMIADPGPFDAGVRPRIAVTLELPDAPYPDWFKFRELGIYVVAKTKADRLKNECRCLL